MLERKEMQQPKVSVCVPVYNAEHTIVETIDSILSQDYPNFELIVIDNCSEDGTWEKLEAYVGFKNVQLIRNGENIAGLNFDRCMFSATGKYTAIFHADDVYEPMILTKQVEVLQQNEEVGAVFTGAKLINERGQYIGSINLDFLQVDLAILDLDSVYKYLLKHFNFLVCPSAMVRTAIYQEEIKHWRGELFGSSMDLDVWLRIAGNHKLAILKQACMNLRRSKSQWSYRSDRISLQRSAFFDVIEYYNKFDNIDAMLSDEDKKNLSDLYAVDDIKVAMNVYLAGQASIAMSYIRRIFSRRLRFSKKRLKVLLACIMLYFIQFWPLKSLGVRVINRIKGECI